VRFQIPYFHALGYGILAPDLLDYGGTSEALDGESYIGSSMAVEIIEISRYEVLEPENGEREVVGIAHDRATYLSSQLAAGYEE
jgi:hypothetical protein